MCILSGIYVKQESDYILQQSERKIYNTVGHDYGTNFLSKVVSGPAGSPLSYILQMRNWATMLREYHPNGNTKVTNTGEPFSLDRLAGCLAIGDNDGDYLMLGFQDWGGAHA